MSGFPLTSCLRRAWSRLVFLLEGRHLNNALLLLSPKRATIISPLIVLFCWRGGDLWYFLLLDSQPCPHWTAWELVHDIFARAVLVIPYYNFCPPSISSILLGDYLCLLFWGCIDKKSNPSASWRHTPSISGIAVINWRGLAQCTLFCALWCSLLFFCLV